jgi:hypothetical protein
MQKQTPRDDRFEPIGEFIRKGAVAQRVVDQIIARHEKQTRNKAQRRRRRAAARK